MSFNPNDVDLDSVDPVDVICYLNASDNEYNGHLGARVSAIFVILIVSTAVTFFPVIAKRVPRLHIPLYVYLFARYFGAGVIIATAFIHLLDPAYGEIGPQTCVGMTGHWADYSWCPAIVLSSLMCIFLLDFGAERYVEVKYGICREDPEPIMTSAVDNSSVTKDASTSRRKNETDTESQTSSEAWIERSFKQQIAAFLILEFGVVFHSVIIGLNLGVVGDEFSTLYPVLVFHQSFEGLGIGARMSAIPFRKGSWLPWVLCALYGLTTPISIAIGLGVRTTYNSGSYTANVVSGVLDAISAGILIYTGLVELLARDFLFDPHRTQDNKRLTFMVVCMLLGAGIMALIGKWA
ncbi:ZIP zinc/iron transport family [Aspergillus homomorphus CBS 101889]|uniref:ZIP zinc/iron transport family n=1 Tax=Aspergillus homomorphus (strain CBS 101889) TaxID=1450537 RepID=A0A395HFT7_ASPHC|nr:ZIP zinc/iron transport family [Aspergillus homomorphus CBS 101889]RAL06727.1 ZIP zinc/iron transport family [Aspergillus homomorphus CBS 101889]